MELRSSRVLKRDKPDIESSIEILDSSDEKKVSLSSEKSTSGKKGASETEIGVCVDNADEDLEIGWSNGSKSVISEGIQNGVNTDDKGLFLGSEVLDPIKDLVASCPEGEIEEESIKRVKIECSGGGGEEGNKSASINLSETDLGFKEEIRSPQNVAITDCENRSEHVNGDEDKETSAAVLDDSSLLNNSKSRRKKGKERRGRKKRNAGILKKNESNQERDTRSADVGSGVNRDGGECTHVKRKRGRKRKNVESSECNGDGRVKKGKVDEGGIQVSGRVLRSKTMTVSGGVEVVDDGLSGTVVGLKRMTTGELETGVDESDQLAGRPTKKRKHRGRPRKVQSENTPSHSQPSLRPRPKNKLERRGRPRKVKHETMPSHMAEIPKKKLERRGRPRKVKHETMPSHMAEIPKKKLERRGRPRKVEHETMPSHMTAIPKKKLERRGRPRKVEHEMMPSHMTEIPKKKLERRGRPRKVQHETMPSHEIPSAPMKSRGRPHKVHQGIQKNRLKDMIKKLKRRDRPLKKEARTLATHMIKMETVEVMDVKRLPTMLKEDGLLEVTGENQQNVQQPEENSQHKPLEKQKRKDFVRDKIVDILLNAGWIIDRRPRQEKAYKDKVYIEPSGRSHWSITRAYGMLKKKIEDGDADSNEVSAFTPIPEEEINMLFRHVDKVLGYKKKKNRIQKDVNSGKKKHKKTKDGSKRKSISSSAVRLAKKSLNKRHRENGIITESRKPRLLARSSEKGSKQDNNGCLVHVGKRNLLSWMIDLGVILPGLKVQYGKTRRQKRSSEGTITSDGIHCSCCNETMGISRFVAHAGGKLNQPFDNIYLESGTSLLKCLLDSWRKEESNTIRFNHVDVKGDDPNDDTCNICGDGGNLICCDGCPSTFHQSCLDIQNFPIGDWNCIYCSCKFCGVVSVSSPQVDDSHDALTSEMLSCCLCEEKFHQLCLQEAEAVNVDSSRLTFCGRKCQELFERLQTYLGVRLELEDGYSWTLLQRSDVGQDFTVHGTQLKVECNSKLAVAFAVMDECFVPIVDERSGTSIIHNVVYNCGSNFRRLNYAGFLTAVLEKGDELITAASIRIHGYQLAEMPFIGTRHMYRRQGMCRRLLDAIESTLASIGVEELIIPAIPELLQTWTKVFGFMPIEESKRQAMKCMSMLVFPGIDMLQKPLHHNQSADRSATPSPSAASDDKAVECTSKPDDKQSPEDAVGIAKDAIDCEKAEEATDLMDGCSCPELNDKSVSQSETMSSNVILYKGKPADAAGVGKDAVDRGQTKEDTVVMDGCSCPKPNDRSVSQFETMSPNAIDDKQRPADAAGVGKDAADYEQTEEITVVMNHCSGPEEDVSNLENDKSAMSHGANSLCDLNFPVKNVRCQVPETTDVRTSGDSVARELGTVDFVKNEQLPPSESFPDCPIQPCSVASVTCGLYQSPKSELDVENDGIPGAKASPLTSNFVPKNTFDLNMHPTAVDTDMHVSSDELLPNEPQVCIKSFELSETRSQVEHGAASRPDSKPCDTHPLVML